ncbi:unnamed protein product [Eretmochelys imbricata]
MGAEAATPCWLGGRQGVGGSLAEILLLLLHRGWRGAVLFSCRRERQPPRESDPGFTVAQDRRMGRRRRYAINPLGYKWDHVNLTYKIVQFPSTLNKGDTERAIAAAFRMWSEVSPLGFRHLPPAQPADITIGFYTFNHTDCWFSPGTPASMD